MQVVEQLNTKSVKLITDFLFDQYGFTDELDFAFFLQSRTSKILMLTKEAAESQLELIRINSQGLYFAEMNESQTNFRLSIDATQFIGPKATKNVLELTDTEFDLWVRGNSLPIDDSLAERLHDLYGYVIIKNNRNDYFGTANQKDGELMNFVPKARRVQSKLE